MKTGLIFSSILLALTLLAGCASQEAPVASAPAQAVDLAAPAAGSASTPTAGPTPEPAPEPSPAVDENKVASSEQMATPENVVREDMAPVSGSEIADGTYPVTVDSSSSMFKVEACTLTVEDGKMTAVMHMGGKGYLKVFMGTGEEAARASEEDCIPFHEEADGTHSFTVPVEALDAGLACAAYSKNKELWYERTLVFRADSLPAEAFSSLATPESLGLADGTYTCAVSLSGGSGKAKVESPAALTVRDGQAAATLVWGSKNYDYMRIGEEKYLPLEGDGNAAFEIPVPFFDRPFTVFADTTAMSTPHEIEYTLTFDSGTLQ